MLELLKKFEEAEAESNRLDVLLEADPENEELEKAWDVAYEKEYKMLEECVKMIVKLSRGQIGDKTARAMVLTQREELKKILK